MKTIYEIIASDPQFSILMRAFESAEMVHFLKEANGITIFAPNDEAFAGLPEGMVARLLDDAQGLPPFLFYHIAPRVATAEELQHETSLNTVKDAMLSISQSGSYLYVDDAQVVQADIRAVNGIIHVIDSVLLPPIT